jgi:hypothetical protein
MQEAGESRGVTRAKPAAPPLLVFLGLMAVLVAVGAIVLFTRDPAPPPPPGTTPPETNFALTDAEAIARFRELRALRDRLYRARDITLMSQIYTPMSPLRPIVSSEVRRLLRARVQDRSTFETRGIDLLSNEPDRVRLRETVLIKPKFVSAQGRDVSIQKRPVEQTVVWTLVPVSGTWLIEKSLITKSEVVHDA